MRDPDLAAALRQLADPGDPHENLFSRRLANTQRVDDEPPTERWFPDPDLATQMVRDHRLVNGRCPVCGTENVCEVYSASREVLRAHGLARPLLDVDGP